VTYHRSFFYAVLFALLSLPLMLHAADNKDAKPASWTDRIKISGDFRYRYEFISQETYNATTAKRTRIYDRNRNRLRFRLAMQAQVNDQLDVYARLATSTFNSGAGDPVSTNQDLSGGFNPKPIWLDRAYADYHPLQQLRARAGKQPVPFENTDLVWDPDLNLEGVSALTSLAKNKNELFFRLGGYWAGERGPDKFSKRALDQGLFGGQIGGKLNANKATVQLAVAYFDYGNVRNSPALYKTNTFYGNSSTRIYRPSGEADTLGYLFDYNLLNVNANIGYKLDKVQPSVVFDFVTNSAAKRDVTYDKKLNTSWLAGLAVKFTALPLDWDFAYNYRVQQKDATLAAYADSDPAGGGTNYKGHKVMLGCNVLPGTRLGITYFRDIMDPENKNTEKRFAYDRVQGDLEVKF
jgi:hypothetical protein